MLNLLLLDKRYISYTFSLRKILGRFLWSAKPFAVEVGGARFLVKPRSADLFTIYEIFYDGGYQPKIRSALETVETVVDFGANIGVFSIWAARAFHPGAVYAVEMEGRCYARLVENIALNRLQATIRPLQAAIYSRTGRVPARRVQGSEFFSIHPGERGLSLAALSFADFLASNRIQTIDLLKVDIEGAEKYLLTEENRGLFRERVRYVLLETHSLNDFTADRCLAYLQGLGYAVETTPTPYAMDKNIIIQARNPEAGDCAHLRR